MEWSLSLILKLVIGIACFPLMMPSSCLHTLSFLSQIQGFPTVVSGNKKIVITLYTITLDNSISECKMVKWISRWNRYRSKFRCCKGLINMSFVSLYMYTHRFTKITKIGTQTHGVPPPNRAWWIQVYQCPQLAHQNFVTHILIFLKSRNIQQGWRGLQSLPNLWRDTGSSSRHQTECYPTLERH